MPRFAAYFAIRIIMEFEKPNNRTVTVLRRNFERLQRHSELLEMYKIKCGHLLDEIKYQQEIIARLTAVTDSDEEEKRIILGEKFDRVINEIGLLETEQVRQTDSRFDKNMSTEDEFQLMAATVRDEHIMNLTLDENVAYIANNFTNRRTDPICPTCYTRMKAVDPRHVDMLTYSEGKLALQEDIYYAFVCESCGYKVSHQYDSIVRKKPVVDDPFVTAEFISVLLKRKYDENISFLTQSIMYQSYDVNISYYALSLWASQAIDKWFIPLYRVMCREIVKSDILYCDNVCLRNYDLRLFPYSGDNRYLWVYHTDTAAKTPMVLYSFCDSSESRHSSAFLRGFSGTVVADKFSSYKPSDGGISIAGSWSMVKMLFVEANDLLVPGVQSEVPSFRAIKCCNKLYQIEAGIDEFAPDIRTEVRKRNSIPVINELEKLIADTDILEKDKTLRSEFAQACVYFLQHEEEFTRYTEDGRLKIDNTCAKEKLLPFVGMKGRKLVCLGSSLEREAAIYSIIESAKLCGLEADRYLCFCMKNMSNPAPGIKISDMFPWNAPGECREEFSDNSDV